MVFATTPSGSTTSQKRMFIDNAGYVGIGTTTPGYQLDVQSSTSYSVIGARYTNTGDVDAIAVYGYCKPADGYGRGGYFEGGKRGVEGRVYPTGSSLYTGVYGRVSGGSGSNFGVHGHASGGTRNHGVDGYASGGTDNRGLFATAVGSTGSTNYGVRGAIGGEGTGYGVYGSAGGAGTNYGVYGLASGPAGSIDYGVYGSVYGSTGSTDYAGYFYGNAVVTGTLTKGGGAFKIDHPLDPAN